jgi:hypothetical protein
VVVLAAAATALPAATDRKRRRVESTGSADVFVGGVLCTRLAWAMGLYLWFGLEPGRKTEPFPSACNYGRH